MSKPSSVMFANTAKLVSSGTRFSSSVNSNIYTEINMNDNASSSSKAKANDSPGSYVNSSLNKQSQKATKEDKEGKKGKKSSETEALELEYRKKLAAQFHYRVQSELAKITSADFENLRVEANIAVGQFRFQQKIKEGSGVLVYDLARSYQLGIQTKKNIDEAREWYEWGCKFHHVPSKFNLSLLLLSCKKDPKDVERGISLLHEVANASIQHGSAQYTLGLCYLRNEFVEIDAHNLQKAYRYFVSAHQLGHPRAKNEIEICFKLFREYGIPIVANHLALSVEARISNSNFGVATSQKAARCIRTDTQELKNMNVGRFVGLKQLVDTELSASAKKDPKETLKLARANFDLAQCYYSGWGVFKDTDMAITYCQKAMQLDYPPADNLMGFIYHAKAKAITNMQEEQPTQESFDANKPLFTMAPPSSPRENDEEQAFKYFSSAATAGYKDAQYNLACCYLDNAFMQRVGMRSTAKNEKQGFVWLMRSAVQGHFAARKKVVECHKEKKSYIPHQLKPKQNTIEDFVTDAADIDMAITASTKISTAPTLKKQHAGIQYFGSAVVFATNTTTALNSTSDASNDVNKSTKSRFLNRQY